MQVLTMPTGHVFIGVTSLDISTSFFTPQFECDSVCETTPCLHCRRPRQTETRRLVNNILVPVFYELAAFDTSPV